MADLLELLGLNNQKRKNHRQKAQKSKSTTTECPTERPFEVAHSDSEVQVACYKPFDTLERLPQFSRKPSPLKHVACSRQCALINHLQQTNYPYSLVLWFLKRISWWGMLIKKSSDQKSSILSFPKHQQNQKSQRSSFEERIIKAANLNLYSIDRSEPL